MARRLVLGLAALLLGLAACGPTPGRTPQDSQVGPADASSMPDAAVPVDAALPTDAAPPDAEVVVPPPITVAVISDLNGSYGSTTYGTAVHDAVTRLVGLAPDLVLSAGDMVAGQQSGLDYEAMWLAFHAAVTDPLTQAGIPLAVTPGNHDASGYSGYEAERAEYEAQWLAHRPAVTFLDDAAYPFRYAFSVGRVLFVALDATRVGPIGSDERAWLDALLALHGPAHDARVVFGHIPLYAVAVGRETEILADAAFEAILESHQVTLYVSGHHHAYYPGRRGTVRHLPAGCLGSDPRALVGTVGDQPRSLALFTIDQGALVSLEAYPPPDFTTPIARGGLPESLGSGDTAYTRDDL